MPALQIQAGNEIQAVFFSFLYSIIVRNRQPTSLSAKF